METGVERGIALEIREFVAGGEVIGGVGGRRIGICRIEDNGVTGLILSSSGLLVTVVVTGIVRLNRRETDGKRGTADVKVGSSLELLKWY